jgi:hypothetical protein
MDTRFLEIPAIHEAGRAVLCSVLNQRMERLSVDHPPRCTADAVAETARGLGALWTSESILRARQEAMIWCAGDIAAHLHFDRQLCKQGLAGKPTIHWAASLAVAQSAVGTQELVGYIEGFLEDARAELDAHWLKVERLAAALLKRRSLSADEAAWILGNGSRDA